MKIVFAGLIGLGTKCLENLITNNFDIKLVITEPPPDNKLIKKELSYTWNIRKKTLEEFIEYNYLHELCKKNNIPYVVPDNLKDNISLLDKIKKTQADTLVVCTFNHIIPENIISIFKNSINVHPGILPEYAGASPIMWTLINGELNAGVTIHKLTKNVDEGDIIKQLKFPVDKYDTGSSINKKISNIYAPQILITTLNEIKAGNISYTPQNLKLRKDFKPYKIEYSSIDFEKMSASTIQKIVKAGNYHYPAYFQYKNKIIIIWETKIVEGNSDAVPGEALGADKQGSLIIQTLDKAIGLVYIQVNDKFSPIMLGQDLIKIQ